MAGDVILAKDSIWLASYSAFHWVGEFLYENLDDPQAKEYVRGVLDHNLPSIALDDFPSAAQRQVVDLLQNRLIDHARDRLPREHMPHRDDRLHHLEELQELAKGISL